MRFELVIYVGIEKKTALNYFSIVVKDYLDVEFNVRKKWLIKSRAMITATVGSPFEIDTRFENVKEICTRNWFSEGNEKKKIVGNPNEENRPYEKRQCRKIISIKNNLRTSSIQRMYDVI